MLKTKPAKSETAHEIPGFASAVEHHFGAGIIVVDGDRLISTITRHAATILGLKAPPSSGSSIQVLPPPLQKLVNDTVETGEAASELEVELKTSPRGKEIVRVSTIPIPQGRKTIGVVLVLEKPGATQQLEEKLWRTDRLANIGTLAAGMAHEIKNALVAGKTFIDLLLERNRDAELVDVVRRELGRIDAIVTRMLKFAGPDRPKMHNVSLHETLQHSLRLVQSHRENRHIALNQSLLAKPDHVQGDDHQLQQAFVNLLLNALDAMGPNGTLSVSTENIAADNGGRRIQVSIADDGEGIAPEIVDRLFEPFFTTKAGGTGLGLPITRRIIEDHHGTISVQSALKQGTTFKIHLPAHSSTAAHS